MKFYIYAYLREDKTPYYVGKGSGSRIHTTHKRGGRADLPLPPQDRRVIIKEFDSEEECYEFEKWMIELYGREIDGGILYNLSVGGGGARCDTTGNRFDMKEYWKEYYQTNKETLYKKHRERVENGYKRDKEKAKEYREKNKEKHKEYMEEYYQANKEKAKEYREKNKEYMKQWRKEYYQANKEKAKEYREKNKEKKREYMKEYRKKRKGG